MEEWCAGDNCKEYGEYSARALSGRCARNGSDEYEPTGSLRIEGSVRACWSISISLRHLSEAGGDALQPESTE